MTAPPGGPYGQDPYGQDPYNQNPARGGQPQGNPYPPNVDPYAQTQHYPTGQPYPPPGGQYPPPGGQYPPPGGQYPPPGGQYPPPGWPYGPPPRSKTPWVIGAVAAVLVLAIAAVTAIFAMRGGDDDTASTGGPSLTASPSVSMTPHSPSASTRAPSTSAPASGEQTATGCTPNVSGGDTASSMAKAGALAFPLSAAPGWQPLADNNLPNGIGVTGVAREVAGAQNWMMEAVVGVTNFVPSMDVAEQASKLMTCVSEGPGYADAQPTLGTPKTSSLKVGGVEAARVDAEITIGDSSRGLAGDVVVVIAVKTEPVTFFLSTTPIGDTESQGTVEEIIKALKVSSS